MNRRIKIVINISMILVLLFMVAKINGMHFSPISAHNASEATIHYGPSEIVHIREYEKGKYILSKYKNWIACDSSLKNVFNLWRIGGRSLFEKNKNKDIDYSWFGSSEKYAVYGIRNNSDVIKIEIRLSNGETLATTDFYENLFLIDFEIAKYHLKSIKAFDINDNVIFEGDI